MPGTPPLLSLAADTGILSTDRITKNGALALSGLWADATIEYSIDGGLTWTASFSALEGANSLQVRQTDTVGTVSDPSDVFTFTLDTSAPAAPAIALTSDTGSSASDRITSNGALTLTGVEAGATSEFSIDGGTTWTSTFTPIAGANSVIVRQMYAPGEDRLVELAGFGEAATLSPALRST